MHLVLLHGYLLQGTGSNIYVANIAKAWRSQGHAVTVVCQDLQAGVLPFVDEYIGPCDGLPEKPPQPGQIRVVVPDINKLLPVYVFDKYEGFEVKTIPQMTVGEIDTHIEMTAKALRQIAIQGTDRVLTNHVMFGPVIANRALRGIGVGYDVKIHGSAIEYTLVPNPRLMDYAVEGLASAQKIFVGTQYVRNRLMEVFADHRESLELDRKLRIVPPGMDPELFNLSNDLSATQNIFLEKIRARIKANGNGRKHMGVPSPNGLASQELHAKLVTLGETYDQRATDSNLLDKWPSLNANEPVILYFGKFLSVKGVGEVLLTAPTILSKVAQARFLFVGFGTYREHMEGMLHSLGSGDRSAFEAYARAGDFVEETDCGKWFRPLSTYDTTRITITGIIDHDALRELLPLASISIVPSKGPEAFGMVAVEAMAAGVLPLCNYHAGLRDVVDEVAAVSKELAALMSLDRRNFVAQLPEKVETALKYLYPDGFDNQDKKRQVSEQLRQISINKFSWDGIARRLVDSDVVVE